MTAGQRNAARAVALATLVATMSAVAAPSPLRGQSAGDIWMSYDSTSGFSSVELRPTPIGADGAVSLHIVAVFKGRVFATPQYSSVAFIADSARARFSAAPSVELAADGARLFFAPSSEVSLGSSVDGGRTVTRVALRVPTTIIAKLAHAGRATARVGGVTIDLTPNDLGALRDYASRLTSEGYARAINAAQAGVAAQGHAGLAVRKDFYEATEVDAPAAPTMMPARPKYPVVDAADRVRREFLIEFVVDSAGRARLRSARSTNRGPVEPYVSAIRDAMATWEYEPAKKSGRPVAQIVRQVLVLDPSGAPRP